MTSAMINNNGSFTITHADGVQQEMNCTNVAAAIDYCTRRKIVIANAAKFAN